MIKVNKGNVTASRTKSTIMAELATLVEALAEQDVTATAIAILVGLKDVDADETLKDLKKFKKKLEEDI